MKSAQQQHYMKKRSIHCCDCHFLFSSIYARSIDKSRNGICEFLYTISLQIFILVLLFFIAIYVISSCYSFVILYLAFFIHDLCIFFIVPSAVLSSYIYYMLPYSFTICVLFVFFCLLYYCLLENIIICF